jgi:hypothetical protein
LHHVAGRRFLAGFVAAPVAFVATSPQALLRAGEFWNDFRTQSRYLHEGWTDVEAENPQRGWLGYLVEFPDATNGVPFAVLCGIGLLLAVGVTFRKRDPKLLLLLATILLLYLFLGSGVFVRMRFLLPVIPLVLLLGAWGLDRLVRGALRVLPGLSPHAWIASLGLGGLLLAPGALASFDALRDEYGRLDPRAELLQWTRESLGPGDAYLQFATMPRLRILETRHRLARFGIREAHLGSEAERRKLRRYLDATPRVTNLETLLADSPSYDTLMRKMREGGYRQLLVVTPTRLFDDLAELPRIIHSPTVRGCSYWARLVAELDQRQPSPLVIGEDNVKMRVYDLPL